LGEYSIPEYSFKTHCHYYSQAVKTTEHIVSYLANGQSSMLTGN